MDKILFLKEADRMAASELNTAVDTNTALSRIRHRTERSTSTRKRLP